MKADVNKHIFTGMHRDLADDKESNQYYYDALNIRIDTSVSGSLMAVTNLAADKVLTCTNNVEINGTIVGDAVINDTLVLFTKYTNCNIYKITFDEPNGTYTPTLLYSDSTGTLVHEYVKDVVVSYENEDVQKVYWTDGYSQPKVINIANTYTSGYSNNWFDFLRPVCGNEGIVIEKLYSGGSFPAGTVQYFMTYFNLYGQESKVFYQSPIMYASDVDNANEPNTSVSNSFKITAADLDSDNWEYVRIYCLSRTSTDTTPSLRIVTEIDIQGIEEIVGYHSLSMTYLIQDVDMGSNDYIGMVIPSNCRGTWTYNTALGTQFVAETTNGSFVRSDGRYLKTGSDFKLTMTVGTLSYDTYYDVTISVELQESSTATQVPMYMKNDVEFTDNGIGMENVDPSVLLYVGGTEVVVQTLSHKDMTLFAGNIEIESETVPDAIKTALLNPTDNLSNSIHLYESLAVIPCNTSIGSNEYYKYVPQLDVGIEFEGNTKKRSRSHYKWNETYRLGVQFMDKLGQWSQPVFVKDLSISTKPVVTGINYRISRPTLVVKDSSIAFQLHANNFIKARPVVVFPSESEREVICQGVLNPTVFNVKDRADNAPFAQASWFFRPNVEMDGYFNYTLDGSNAATYDDTTISPFSERDKSLGSTIPFQHLKEIKGSNSFRSEIQILRGDPWSKAYYNGSEGNHKSRQTEYFNYDISAYTSQSEGEYVSANSNYYFIDQNIVTLNSPDIDFNDNIANTNLSSCKFRIVGAIELNAVCGDITIRTSSVSQHNNAGLFHKSLKLNDYNDDITDDSLLPNDGEDNIPTFKRASRNLLTNGIFWFDSARIENDTDMWGNDTKYKTNLQRGWVVYPFQKNGGIGNISDYGVISSKVISNIRFSSATRFLTNPLDINTDDIKLFNEAISKSISLNGHIYFGDSDKILVGSNMYYNCSHGVNLDNESYGSAMSTHKEDLYRYPWMGRIVSPYSGSFKYPSSKYYRVNPNDPNVTHKAFAYSVPDDRHITSGAEETEHGAHLGARWTLADKSDIAAKDKYYEDTVTVPITYRSSPHVVLALGSNNGSPYILPTVNNMNSGVLSNGSKHVFWDDNITSYTQGNINIVDSSNNQINVGNLLIGELYREVPNKFGGTSDYALSHNVWNVAGEAVDITNNGFTLFWDEGDTYFQRYDCLKTMPLHNDDVNQIVEILSFMCETRINIDGRYDTNRGLESNLYVDDTNFNLINKAYTQNDNFFQYNILDERFNVDKFPNQITWTLNKVLGAKTDNWSSLTMANTLDLDGDKGEIVSLNRFANDIYSFQPKGIAQILYNVNAQISTANGLPIELANSGKVSGKRYLTENNGTYGSQYGAVKSVVETSTGLYFYDKVNNNVCVLNGNGVTPLSDKNLMKSILNPLHDISFVYDKANSDIHIIDSSTDGFKNGEHHLVYNELVGQFTTFLNRDNKVLPSVGSISVGASYSGGVSSILENYAGTKYLDSAIEFVENKESTVDKVFTNLEFRTDDYTDGVISVNNTFNRVNVYNDYQSIDHTLSSVDQYYPLGNSNIARKFRVWRVQVGMQNGQFSSAGLERIIGTWAKIRLEHNNHPNDKLILYDVVTKFYMH